jgi:hypothetical protein
MKRRASVRARRRARSLVLLIATVSVVVFVASLAVSSGPGQAAETSSTDSVVGTTTTDIERPSSRPSESLPADMEEPGLVKASGPVPSGIVQAAATGDPFYQLAKYVWESGGDVIPTPDGEYIIPMPEKIPADFVYPPEKIPARGKSEGAISIDDVSLPPYLDPSENGLFAKYVADGLAFILEQGPDGYRHVVR